MPQSLLELQYQADSWSEISDAAGRKLAYGLIPAGKQLTLRGQAPFRVFLGYASGVTVYYNGALYDHTPFQNGDMARFRLGRAEHNRPLSGN
jgi:cytoskeleton protein RodZ